MKNKLSYLLLMLFDILMVYISITITYYLTKYFGSSFSFTPTGDVFHYSDKVIVYILILINFIGFKVYKYRHDFWEETSLIIKSLVLSSFMLFSVFALTKTIDEYSRSVILLSFIVMTVLIPLSKFVLKKKLNLFGLWSEKAFMASSNSEIIEEIFGNRYLGYVGSSEQEADVVFMDTVGISKEKIEEKLSFLAHEKKKVVFIPMINTFNYSNAGIVEIFNARTNMIILENSLLKKTNILVKKVTDAVLSILLVPFLIPIFGIIILKMKKEKPNGSIFFKQERLGKNGEIFVCYKFRSMREDGADVLATYLQENPEEVENYATYHKYENDPRITKVGDFLRRTSLDELPQIINVFKGEMSLIGPRPYMLNEKEKIGSKIDMVLAVKPGISGLWQVSGRSDVDFYSRVDMDIYYTRNWNLWFDIVILLKTIRTVLFREGAS